MEVLILIAIAVGFFVAKKREQRQRVALLANICRVLTLKS